MPYSLGPGARVLQIVFSRRFCLFILTGVLLFSVCEEADAQRKRRRGKRRLVTHNRSLNDNLDVLSENTFDLNFPDTANDVLENSVDTDLYDPLTVDNLKRLKEDAQPYWNPDELDPVITRRVAEKALAIQTGQSLSSLVRRSDLRQTYRTIKQGLSSIRDSFRYRLQDGSDGLLISKEKKGTALLELDLQFNASQGVDPQIRIGEYMRFRFDYVDKRPMLEYGVNF